MLVFRIAAANSPLRKPALADGRLIDQNPGFSSRCALTQ
jgi:hypothetical protein